VSPRGPCLPRLIDERSGFRLAASLPRPARLHVHRSCGANLNFPRLGSRQRVVGIEASKPGESLLRGDRSASASASSASWSSHALQAARSAAVSVGSAGRRVRSAPGCVPAYAPGSSEMALRCHGSRQTDRPKPRPSYFGHRPFGCQSWVIVTHGLDESCNTRTTDRLISLPTLESAIAGPSSTTAPSPACLTVMPLGVSRH
jgi:hypothetical protein